jgi:hypothetical protein
LHFSTLCGHHFFPPFENLKVTSLTALPFYIYFGEHAFLGSYLFLCQSRPKPESEALFAEQRVAAVAGAEGDDVVRFRPGVDLTISVSAVIYG